MTVGELIQRLQNYHDATPVLVDGYEDGYDEVAFALRRVVRLEEPVWWNGLYDEDNERGTEALILGRRIHPKEEPT